MGASANYMAAVQEKLRQVAESQTGTIEEIAAKVLEAYQKGGFLYAFGTGHSHMMAEELFYRAGGLARVKPMLEEELMLHIDASGSSLLERKPELGLQLAEAYGVGENDVVIIASNSGRNTVAIDLALESRRRGATVVALTSLTHSRWVTSRHPGGKRLFEVSDFVLDNHSDAGDAALEIGRWRVGAVSTVTGAAMLQALAAAVVQQAVDKNIEIEVFLSGNVDDGDAYNKAIVDKYRGSVRGL